MNPDKYQSIFSTIALVVALVLAILVFWPFATVLAIALIMAILLRPIYNRIKKIVRKDGLSAMITILCLIIVIIVPLVLVTNTIVSQAQSLYVSVSTSDVVASQGIVGWAEAKIQQYIPDFSLDARKYLAGVSSWIVSKLGGVFSGTIDFVFKLAISFVALFYFLRDGEKLRSHIEAITPWGKGKDEVFIKSTQSAVRGIVAGSLVIALIQGFMSGVGFAISGVPNATLWGTVAAICALVPGVGTAIVWIPAVIYLAATDASTVAVVFQIIWAVAAVGLIDNLLGPMILQKGINIHPLLILLSVLGGIQFFGPEGFILGPLVLSILFVLVRMLKSESEHLA